RPQGAAGDAEGADPECDQPGRRAAWAHAAGFLPIRDSGAAGALRARAAGAGSVVWPVRCDAVGPPPIVPGMNRIIRALAILLCIAATAAHAQLPQTLPANSVVGRLGIGSGPGQAIPFSVLSGPVGTVTGTVSGTASAITLSTGLGLTSLSDGQEFVFVPLSTVAGAVPTIAVDSVAAKTVKGVDGYSFPIYYDIQKGKPLHVRYLASLDVFAILSPPTQFEDTLFGHGTVKLAAASPTALSVFQDDGQGLLLWNSDTSAPRLVRLPSITASNLFSGNSTIVNGSVGQNLANSKLYSIYVNNTTPTNQFANNLEFWETYS